MKAKKVFEMIDPYASEDADMDLDVSYKSKVLKKKIENWFEKYDAESGFKIGNDLSVETDDLYLDDKNLKIIPFDKLKVGYVRIVSCENLIKMPKEIISSDTIRLARCIELTNLPEILKAKKIILRDVPKITRIPLGASAYQLNLKSTGIKELPDYIFQNFEEVKYTIGAFTYIVTSNEEYQKLLTNTH